MFWGLGSLFRYYLSSFLLFYLLAFANYFWSFSFLRNLLFAFSFVRFLYFGLDFSFLLLACSLSLSFLILRLSIAVCFLLFLFVFFFLLFSIFLCQFNFLCVLIPRFSIIIWLFSPSFARVLFFCCFDYFSFLLHRLLKILFTSCFLVRISLSFSSFFACSLFVLFLPFSIPLHRLFFRHLPFVCFNFFSFLVCFSSWFLFLFYYSCFIFCGNAFDCFLILDFVSIFYFFIFYIFFHICFEFPFHLSISLSVLIFFR